MNTPENAIKAVALRLLARREHSAHELRQKLLLRNYTSEQIAPVLAYLAEQGWQSEQRFAQAYVNSRIQRGDGLVKIRAALYQRGVNKDIVAEALNQEESFWFQQLLHLCKKKYNSKLFQQNRLMRAQAQRFFLSRGYTSEQIQRLWTYEQ